jgi:phosphate transport system protein
MNMRSMFEKELEGLHQEIAKMGSLVEKSIVDATEALVTQDEALAREVFKNDDVIDFYEKKIEHHCINLIARQQPIARDLRYISSVLKVITDLERIADHASEIAQLTITMANERYIKKLIDIPRMAELVKAMVAKALDSFVTNDITTARAVYDSDEEVDVLFCKIVLELKRVIRDDPSSVDQAINFMNVAKYYERIADHSTNICEWVNYNVTGVHESFSHKLFEEREIKDRFKDIKESDLTDNF